MRYHQIIEKSKIERRAEAGTHSDQFFTKPEVAEWFAGWVKSQPFYSDVKTVIEPSAGNKDIAQFFPGAKMYDLDPKHSDITQQDWLKYQHTGDQNVLVVGNPPFGKNNTLAVKFINKAAEFADWIAFILPKGFKRTLTQNRISSSHSLYAEQDLPKNSFYLPNEKSGKPYDVPAVAQIWHKKKRNIEKKSYDNQWFVFTTPDKADIAIKRAGQVGQINLDKNDWINHLNRQYYYIKSVKDLPKLLQILKQVDWRSIADNTVGAPVISKFDVVQAVRAFK